MIRLLTVALVFAMAAGSARAGVMFTILDKPATYTPGDAFTVQIEIENVMDLAAFDLELKLSSDSLSAIAGTDFGFVPFTDAPSSSDYVFDGNPTDFFFLQIASVDATSTYAYLAVGDVFDSGDRGVSVGSGTPRLLAEATIFTTLSAGNLTLTFGDFIALYLPMAFDEIDLTDASYAGEGSIAPVPEPGSAAIFGMGLLGLCLVWRRRPLVVE